MAEIRLANLAHAYGDATYALISLDMTWRDGGTYALLGPSGCGKSTMLNTISGLLKPSEGRVLFDGVDVTNRDTGARNIAQVFQVPVIYRSMTVAENLGFPLVCRRVPGPRIKARVDAIVERPGLTTLLRVRATALTADQKQLVSLGRGLVRDDVSAVLLDEPLIVIDPQMKFELRKILREINRDFGLTMVLVTHDQNEALTFADTVVVMNHGEVIQAGSPQDLFDRPATTHVGTFIGSPAMNFLPATRDSNRAILTGTDLSMALPPGAVDGALTFGFLPEHFGGTGAMLTGRITRVWFEGAEQVVGVEVTGHALRAQLECTLATVGDTVRLHLPQHRLWLYKDGTLIAKSAPPVATLMQIKLAYLSWNGARPLSQPSDGQIDRRRRKGFRTGFRAINRLTFSLDAGKLRAIITEHDPIACSNAASLQSDAPPARTSHRFTDHLDDNKSQPFGSGPITQQGMVQGSGR